MTIHDTVLNGQPPRPPAPGVTYLPPRNGRTPTTPRQHYGNDPGSILEELDRWGALLDEYTEEYSEVVAELGPVEYRLERERAFARERAKHRPNARDRRTNDDLHADVVRSKEVDAIALRWVELDCARQALFAKMKNAERQMDRLRTHAASSRVINPYTT